MTRLRKVKKLENKETKMINKTAGNMMNLEDEMLPSGDIIGIAVRTVNWQPWFQVYLEYGQGSSSFYDGPDASRAFSMYRDLLLAFKGVKAAENFKKALPKYQKQLEMFVVSPKSQNLNDYYHNLLLKKPSFLGYN